MSYEEKNKVYFFNYYTIHLHVNVLVLVSKVYLTEKHFSLLLFFFSGTFKLKKVDLRKEGFNPSIVKDPLYCLISGRYQPITEQVYNDICSGKIRL